MGQHNGYKNQQYRPPQMQQEEVADALRVTTVRDLEKYRKGNIVELPPFGEGQPFVARLQRPSMLMLAKSNEIPNALLTKATRLFYKGGDISERELADPETLPMMFDVMECIVKASLIEPSYDDIKKVGMALTDDQMMFIFNYSQQGVNALSPFRGERPGDRVMLDGEPIQAEAVGAARDR